ncbi:MAG TPA: hypothetical protein VF337_10070 [Candidatus Limnocylindrales bacterium]
MAGDQGLDRARSSQPPATTGSTVYADTPIGSGVSNSYYVVAFDAANNVSVASNTASATTPAPDTTAPSAPSNVTVSAPVWNATTVAWTASTDNTAVVGYTIKANGSVVAVVNGSTTSFTDVATQPSTTYLYTVTASDAAGNSTASGSVSVTTPPAQAPTDTAKPSTPTALTATPAPGEIDLAWTASTEPTGHIAGYNVLRDGLVIATTYSLSYADLGLAAGTSHTYTVVALNGSANGSEPSTAVTASANTPLPSASGYTYDIGDRLTAITTPSGSLTSFTLDALGRHASQTVGSGPSSAYSYLGTSDTVVAISSSASTTLSAIDAIGDRVATSGGGSRRIGRYQGGESKVALTGDVEPGILPEFGAKEADPTGIGNSRLTQAWAISSVG